LIKSKYRVIESYRIVILPGDMNFDGTVNASDLLIFSQAWLSSPADTNWNSNCDIAEPADKFIGLSDLAVLSSSWAKN
jgi:hypothetical protein